MEEDGKVDYRHDLNEITSAFRTPLNVRIGFTDDPPLIENCSGSSNYTAAVLRDVFSRCFLHPAQHHHFPQRRPGVFVELFEALKLILNLNVTELVWTDDYGAFSDDNRRASGILGLLQNGSIDLSLAPIPIDYFNISSIAYSYPIIPFHYAYIVQRPKVLPELILAQPFSYATWAVIVAFVVLAFLLLKLMPELMTASVYDLQLQPQQHFQLQSTASYKSVKIFFLFLSVILFECYSNCLAIYFSKPGVAELPFRNYRELAEKIRSKRMQFIYYRANKDFVFSTIIDPYRVQLELAANRSGVRLMHEAVVRNPPRFVDNNNVDDILRAVATDNRLVFPTLSYIGLFLTRKVCNLMLIEETAIDHRYLAFYTRADFARKLSISDSAVLRYKFDRILSRYYNYKQQGDDEVECKETRDLKHQTAVQQQSLLHHKLYPLSIYHLEATFYLLALGAICATLVLSSEIFYRKLIFKAKIPRF